MQYSKEFLNEKLVRLVKSRTLTCPAHTLDEAKAAFYELTDATLECTIIAGDYWNIRAMFPSGMEKVACSKNPAHMIAEWAYTSRKFED